LMKVLLVGGSFSMGRETNGRPMREIGSFC
jgi:hypothetical protein